jgi:nitroreductase
LDVLEAIKTRRSVRNFTSQPVSDKEIRKLLDAATRAPTAGNIQPWEFIVVRKPEIKHGLSQAALDQKFIEQAPVVIVVCADPAKSALRYGSRGINLYCLQDTAAATQNILLAAHALGLGACWVGAFKEEMARKVLKIPEPVRPVAIIPVGHAERNPTARPRKALLDVTHHDAYGPK